MVLVAKTIKFIIITVIILLKENQVVIDNDIIENSMNDKETVVKLGETIGKKY